MTGSTAKVYLWSNDMVMTFDASGDQIPAMQGRLTADLLRRLDAAATGQTLWFTGDWQAAELTEEGRKGWGELANARMEAR